MASTNQSPFYQRAEEEFSNASTDEERIACLEIMLKECPKHKSSENMLRNLTLRYKKLKSGVEKKTRSKKGVKGIKKADIQCTLVGLPNSGKSTIFNILTNNNPKSKISEYPYSTHKPILGTFDYQETKVQIIDDAPIPAHNKSTVNATDVLLIIINSLNEIEEIEKYIYRANGKRIYFYNKFEDLNETQMRKLTATMKSKHKTKQFYLLKQTPSKLELEDCKKTIFSLFDILRIYTKEPKKQASKDPMLLKPGSSVQTVAEKILKGMAGNVTQARIWGPSSKFGGQKVGIEHKIKDKDVVEFKTK